MTATDRAADLVIPPAAADAWFVCGCGEDCGRAGYQHEALPIVVAAELRKQADDMERSLGGNGMTPGSVHILRHVRALRARADELDPS